MNPVMIVGLGLGAWGVSKLLRKPTAADYQKTVTTGPGGIPVIVATPVPNVVTSNQATGTPAGPPTPGKPLPVPTTIPGAGTVYGPPNTIHATPDGNVLQLAPIVITPTGASSVAIGSVLDVQRALNTLGYQPTLAEDGKLGPMTIGNIKQFQGKNNLVVDGNAGPATKAALSNALTTLSGGGSAAGATAQNSDPASGTAVTPAGVTVNTVPALQMTMTDIQHSLNTLGASPPLAEDGKAGPKTIAAVKSFQAAHGLTPDGIAGPKTKTALFLATQDRVARPAAA